MKTRTMLWIGAAAVAGYYLAKRAQVATDGAAQAVTGAATASAPTVVVVDPSDDYGWVGASWVPTWTTMTRADRAHRHGGGGGHGGHHGGHH